MSRQSRTRKDLEQMRPKTNIHKTDCTPCAFLLDGNCQLNRHQNYKDNGVPVFKDGENVSVAAACSAFRTHEWKNESQRAILDVLKEISPTYNLVILDNYLECSKLEYAFRIFVCDTIEKFDFCQQFANDNTKVLYYILGIDTLGYTTINQIVKEFMSSMNGSHIAILNDLPHNIFSKIYDLEVNKVKKYRLYTWKSSCIIHTLVPRLSGKNISDLIYTMTTTPKYKDFCFEDVI